MFGIHGIEIFLILLFGFLIFGPDKIPVIAKTLGQAINKFRGAQEEMSKVIKTEVYDPASDEPFKNPLDALSKVVGGDKAGGASGSEATSGLTATGGAKSGSDTSGKTKATAATAATAAAGKAESAKTAPGKTTTSSRTVSTSTSGSQSSAASPQKTTQVKGESFTERKARYEKERAEKQAAAEKRAQEAPKPRTMYPDKAKAASADKPTEKSTTTAAEVAPTTTPVSVASSGKPAEKLSVSKAPELASDKAAAAKLAAEKLAARKAAAAEKISTTEKGE